MEDVSDDDSFLAAVLNDLTQIDLLLDEDGGVEDDYDEWKCDPDRPRTIEQAYARWGTDRGWKDEVRYSQEQFEYLAEQLVIPELFPTAEQQQRTKTCEPHHCLPPPLYTASVPQPSLPPPPQPLQAREGGPRPGQTCLRHDP